MVQEQIATFFLAPVHHDEFITEACWPRLCLPPEWDARAIQFIRVFPSASPPSGPSIAL